MTRRINARLEPELARKVEALRKRTGQSTTDIVKASLEAYCITATRATKPAEGLADLVACATGPRTLSTDYKRDLTRSLVRKPRS
jgi:hypothetical protein